MAWGFTFPNGAFMIGWDWLVLQHQSVADRFLAWQARWDGTVQGTMPLSDNPDPMERIRGDFFRKRADGLTQRLANTKCWSCRYSKSPVQKPRYPYQEDLLYCGCRYDEAVLEAYLIRSGFLGPTVDNVPTTLAPDTRNMILLLLRDQFGPQFEPSHLIDKSRRLAGFQSAINNNEVVDLPID